MEWAGNTFFRDIGWGGNVTPIIAVILGQLCHLILTLIDWCPRHIFSGFELLINAKMWDMSDISNLALLVEGGGVQYPPRGCSKIPKNNVS